MSLSGIATNTLTRLNDAFRAAGWFLAGLATLALFAVWVTGRELERRRAKDTATLQRKVETSEQAVARAEEEARSLRQRLAPRDVRLNAGDR